MQLTCQLLGILCLVLCVCLGTGATLAAFASFATHGTLATFTALTTDGALGTGRTGAALALHITLRFLEEDTA